MCANRTLKTYPSKTNRFSSYRPSAVSFYEHNNDLFDQLLNDETSKKQHDSVNTKLSAITPSSGLLKNVQNIKTDERRPNTNTNFPIRKSKKKISTGIKNGKENWKHTSRLFASDSDNESQSFSVYDWSYSKKNIRNKKLKKPKKLKIVPKTLTETPQNSKNISEDNRFLAPWNPACLTKSSSVETKNERQSSATLKTDELIFKKPEPYVEGSSDLFYNKSYKNQGQSKTRKKLSFLNSSQEENRYPDDSFEKEENRYSMRISMIPKTVESELFDSDIENETPKENENFSPKIISTPNRHSNNSVTPECIKITENENNATPIHKKSSVSIENVNNFLEYNLTDFESNSYGISKNEDKLISINISNNYCKEDDDWSLSSLLNPFQNLNLSELVFSIHCDLSCHNLNETKSLNCEKLHEVEQSKFNITCPFEENRSAHFDSSGRYSDEEKFLNCGSLHKEVKPEFNISYASEVERSYFSSPSSFSKCDSPPAENQFPTVDNEPNDSSKNIPKSNTENFPNLDPLDESFKSNQSISNTSFHLSDLSQIEYTSDTNELSEIKNYDNRISPVEQQHSDKNEGSFIAKISKIEDELSLLKISNEHKMSSHDTEILSSTKFSNAYSEEFKGWSESDIAKSKSERDNYKTFNQDMKMMENFRATEISKNKSNSTDFSVNCQFITVRRKKKCALPTLNEEECCENSDQHVQNEQNQHLASSQTFFYDTTDCIDHPSIFLDGGKKWRRSFIALKNLRYDGFELEKMNDGKGRCWKTNIENLILNQPDISRKLNEIEERSTINADVSETIISSKLKLIEISEKCNRPEKARFSLRLNTKRSDESGESVCSSDNSKIFSEKSYVSFSNESCTSKIDSYELEAGDYTRCSLLDRYDIRDHFSAREVVLRHCKQIEPLSFEECFNDRILQNCQKIGEGVYGEVFMLKRNKNHSSVLKIIPIEGDTLINGEKQKKFEEIVSELIISVELSNLRKRKDYYTNNFAELRRCWCVYGKYPQQLLDLWNEYDVLKGSENDSPKVFTENQLYIIFELSHGGEDIESFVFNNAQQALSVFIQVTNALAVAEKAFMFEHRDLHWGNILVSKCKSRESKYIIRDSKKVVRLCGVKATIIDYTLSRVSVNNRVLYNDIGQDPELFTAKGDFQFEIYRKMKNEVRDVWDQFIPKTNIFWLHYLLDKMIKEIRYGRVNTKIHQSHLEMLEDLYERVLRYDGAYDLCCDRYLR